MRLAAVESAHNLVFQSVGFGRIFCFNHSPGKLAQFFSAELANFLGMTSELNNPAALVLRQPLYFFDDLSRCHALSLVSVTVKSKRENGNA